MITPTAEGASPRDCEQLIHERRITETGKEEGVHRPADLETPRLSPEECTDQGEDTTESSVDDQSPRDGWKMLALSVLGQAIREDKGWFARDNCKGILKFWCELAGLDAAWVKARVSKPATVSCPGLFMRGETWWVQIYHEGQRHMIRLGRDLDWAAAAQLGKIQREAVKQNGEVMAATS